jgi:predicted nucleotidyltransferase component of viral defense system
MIHDDQDEFVNVLDKTAQQKKFPLPMLEKDYYMTLILSRVAELSEDLVFKGGTCLSKIYFDYFRLSEDVDFSMKLPSGSVTRGARRKYIQPIKDKIEKFAQSLGMKIEGAESPGRNESKQYIYYFVYRSALRPMDGKIKFEVGLRYSPICRLEKHQVRHYFLHPFTGAVLFDGGSVNCLTLKELVAEKLRAAATRLTIAPRDFYDLGFLIKFGFDFKDKELWHLLEKKLAEDNFETDLEKYRVNLGRSEKEIRDMKSRVEAELLDVLTVEERKAFDLEKTLDALNEITKEL